MATSKVKNVWTENFRITSPLVNPLGRLGLYGLLNLLQETAWMHAETLGFGLADMQKQGLFWVLTRQRLEMKAWPNIAEMVRIDTWLRKPDEGFVARDFKIYNSKDQQLGSCTTSWLALDRRTRKILPTLSLRPWGEICYSDSTNLVADKIPADTEYTSLAKFSVRNSDLDINQHVNNTKYAQWILDSIPYELHRKLTLNGYTVNFLAETHLGDEVQIERAVHSSSDENANQGITTYRGRRSTDQKALFAASLEWSSNLNVGGQPLP